MRKLAKRQKQKSTPISGTFLGSPAPHKPMSKDERPTCIGMLGETDECRECESRQECEAMTKQLEADAYRGGTHVRITGKYKERKYKPKKAPG